MLPLTPDGSPHPPVVFPRQRRARAATHPDSPVWGILEILAAIAVSGGFAFWARDINVDPLDQVGRVSGIAALEFRFGVVAIAVVAVLLAAHRLLSPGRRRVVERIGCAVVAGLVTGMVAGGIVIALRGTDWALWAAGGDYRPILDWAGRIGRNEEWPDHYPPGIVYLLHWWSTVTHQPMGYALQDIQLAGTALFGPAAYLAWRLVLRPFWALAIGVVAMLPFIEAVKPYPQLTLVMLVPVLIALLRKVRQTAEPRPLFGLPATTLGGFPWALFWGAVHGAGLGLLFLLYSGSFVWAAGGVVLAFALLAPWRTGWRRALVLAGTAVLTFAAVSWSHLIGLLEPARGAMADRFFYFDTFVEPAYIAMWRNDRPADILDGPWPPPGELGGVGLFSVLLFVGLAVALWLSWRRTAVVTMVSIVAGAWMMRMWLASEMFETRSVRLYPRTTMIILYGLLALTGFAVMYAVDAIRGRAGAGDRRVPLGVMLVPVLFLLASAGSSTVDRWLPDQRPGSFGYFTWIAQMTPHLDGTCPRLGKAHGCADHGP